LQRKLVAILIAAITLLSTVPLASASNAEPQNAGAVYIIDNAAGGNNVWVYAMAEGGSLGPGVPVSTDGLGTGAGLGSQGAVALTKDGNWLLVVDAGSNEISVFRVHDDGLTFASKTSSHGSTPISLTVNKNRVYVLDAGGPGNIAGFTLSRSGVLTYIAGSNRPLSGAPAPSPEQIGFSPNGDVLVVSEKATNTVDTYTVDDDGLASAPALHPSAGNGPYGFAFTNNGRLVISEAATNTVSSYAVSEDGGLRTISAAVPTLGAAPCWLVVTNGGHLAFTTNAHSGTISVFSVSRTGALTLSSSTAAKTDIPALDIALAQKSQLMYVHDGAAITGYQISPDGNLSMVTSVSGVPSSAAGLAAA
jgi:6-phosphogluconolactonase